MEMGKVGTGRPDWNTALTKEKSVQGRLSKGRRHIEQLYGYHQTHNRYSNLKRRDQTYVINFSLPTNSR